MLSGLFRRLVWSGGSSGLLGRLVGSVPSARGGGVGDLTTKRTSDQNCDLMITLAAQAGNSYWQWYVDEHPVQEWPKSAEEAKTRRLDAVGAGRSLYINFV